MVKKILFLAVDFLAWLFNPYRLPVCRFQPTCSCYAKAALAERALPVAVFLIARRILRCQPFST